MTRVISADCHINEPPWVFDRVPESVRDRVPRLTKGTDGGDGWSFQGETPERTYGIETMAGRSNSDRVSGLRFEDILPGNYDGAAHAADMDLDGVDVSVVYPGIGAFIYSIDDREVGLACLRSYNDWILEDFQGAAPGRIVALPMLPVDDGMETCLAELHRVLAKGARAGFLPGQPVRPYHDPLYDPLWAAAEETGTPLTFHRTFGGRTTELDWDRTSHQKVSAAGTVWRFFNSAKALSYMILGGVFQRHPDLRIIAGEVNFSWVPFWGQTMDQQYENEWYRRTGGVSLDRRPSEVLGENVFVTVLDDDLGFRMVAEGFWPRLADLAMFSSDYPHSVCLWPDTRKHVERLTVGWRQEDLDKVLHGTAERLYKL
jgi:predicted TIM-barrel fold metal-dependent hydrolase